MAKQKWLELSDEAAAIAAANSRELDILALDNPSPALEVIASNAVEARYCAREAREIAALAEIQGDSKELIIHSFIAMLNAAFAQAYLGMGRRHVEGGLEVTLPTGFPTELTDEPKEPDAIPDEELFRRPVLFDDGDALLSFIVR